MNNNNDNDSNEILSISGLPINNEIHSVLIQDEEPIEVLHDTNVLEPENISCDKSFVIFGESGTGKTTLIGCLLGKSNMGKPTAAQNTTDIKTYKFNKKIDDIDIAFKMIDTVGLTGNRITDAFEMMNLFNNLSKTREIHRVVWCVKYERSFVLESNLSILKTIKYDFPELINSKLIIVLTGNISKELILESRIEFKTWLERNGVILDVERIIFVQLPNPALCETTSHLNLIIDKWKNVKNSFLSLMKNVDDNDTIIIGKLGFKKLFKIYFMYYHKLILFLLSLLVFLSFYLYIEHINSELLKANKDQIESFNEELEKIKTKYGFCKIKDWNGICCTNGEKSDGLL